MKNLLEFWDEMLEVWDDKKIILFLDYDGTLAPIVAEPSQVVLPDENKRLIEQLAQMPLFQVVILSGRTLVDIKQRVGLEGVIYIGNHGWEIEGDWGHFESLVPVQYSSTLERVKYELMTQLSSIQGAWVEDKGITLSVHYRMVAPEKEFLVKRIFDYITMPYRRKNEIRVQSGKKVFELKPAVDWDKGKAALWLLRKQEILEGKGKVLAVYIGDDATDEDAFGALKNRGITVLVGESRFSSARYFLPDTSQVTELLKRVVENAGNPAVKAVA